MFYSTFLENQLSQTIPNETAEIADFHFSYYKSIDTLHCHGNKSGGVLTVKSRLMQTERTPAHTTIQRQKVSITGP